MGLAGGRTFSRSISLMQSVRVLASIISNTLTFLSATARASLMQRARYTSLNCPVPIFFSTTKLASVARGEYAGCFFLASCDHKKAKGAAGIERA